MGFGASPSDIIIVVTFCRELYRKFRDAAGEYDEISREVRGLHTVLKHLKYEVEAPESPLNKDHSIWGRQLAPIIGDCDFTLRQLDELLQKYGRLGNNGGPSPSSPSSARVLWDRVKFGSNEMDQLGAVRVKLISHKTSLTLFLDTIQLHQSGKMAVKLDCHQGQLDTILDKVDNIAARLEKKRDGSIMTSYDDDDKEVWKQFRRALVAEGFSSDVLQQHMDVLRAYIREIDQKGQLDEPRTLPAVDAEHRVDSVHSATSEDVPPSFSSLGTSTDDGSAKEMMVREENMKFPQSIKLERRQPETRNEETHSKTILPTESNSRAVEIAASQVPLKIPVAPKIVASDEKVFWHNTDGSSDDESEDETSSIIRTTDLRALTQAIQLRVPGSPSSFRSSVGSIGSDGSHSMTLRPNQPQHMSSSPARLGAIPIPSNANPRSSAGSFGTSPIFKLAPDGHGNEIPADAKWTKIDRKLVSPEVLNQDRRRYEARPEFVAILGELSRKEIEDLAARSQTLRNARRRKSASQNSQEKAPLSPPRPIPVQQPSSYDRRRLQRSSSSSSSRSDSETSESEDSYHRRHHHNKHKPHSDASSTKGIPIHGYPNPYGVPPSPPPGPDLSSTARQAIFTSNPPNQQPPPMKHSFTYNGHNTHAHPHFDSHQNTSYWPNSPPRQQQYEDRDDRRAERRERPRNDRQMSDRTRNDRDRDPQSDRDRDRDGSRRRHHSTSSKFKSNAAPIQQQGRWKRDLKVAGIGGGIGGAAVSLLNVLVEAAEAL